jgi:phage shock protein E
MKRFAIATLAAFLSFTGLSYAGSDQPQEPIPEQRAWRLIDDGALLIDVRSRQEYEAGHLENSINIEHDKIEKIAEVIGEDKDREVVVYCRSGRRSGEAKKSLEKYGYKNIHNGLGYEGLKKARDKTG